MNLTKIDGVLKKVAGLCLLVGGGTGFSGLLPVWFSVVISFLGVLAGALATSPVFAGAAESGWNMILQGLTAVFAAAAGSSQLEAVQNLIMPAHPVLAAKLGLGAMLGAQVFAYLAQRGNGPGPARLALLAVFLALPATSGCAAIVSQLPNVIAYVQDAELIIQTIQSVMNNVWILHPDPPNQKLVNEAVAKVETSLDAINRIAQGGEKLNQAQLEAAFADFQAAFSDLMSLVGPYGVRVGDVPKTIRTASGGYVVPRPTLLSVSR